MNYLESVSNEIYTCNMTRCQFCRADCPEYRALQSEAYTPAAIMQSLRALADGHEEVLPSLQRQLFECSMCGYCEFTCALGNMNVLTKGRAELVKRNLLPKPLATIIMNIKKTGNPYGQVTGKRLSSRDKCDELVFAGCSYWKFAQKSTRRFIAHYNSWRRKSDFVDSSVCCGAIALRLGSIDLFKDMAESLLDVVKSRRAKEMLVLSPECNSVLVHEYPRYGYKLPVAIKGLVRFLAETPSFLGAMSNGLGNAYWYDPCMLTRGVREVEASKKLASRLGIKMVTPNGYETICCGGWGGLPAYDHSTSLTYAKNALQQYSLETNASVVVPSAICKNQLITASKQFGMSLKVHELTEVLPYSAGRDAPLPRHR